MTIALRPEIESALAIHSLRRGMTPDELAQQLLQDKLQELECEPDTMKTDDSLPQAGESLADLFAGRLGVIRSSQYVSGGARLSENTGQKFTEILLEKKKQGKI